MAEANPFLPRALWENQRPITASEFESMLESGLFADEHVELIQGRITMLLAQGPHHVGLLEWLIALFTDRLVDAYGSGQRRVAIRVQSTTRFAPSTSAAAERAMPEADLMLIDGRRAFRGEPLHPEEVFLACEVADSSLEKDLTEKARLYAALGVPLLWVLDLPHRRLHVFRSPDMDQARYLEVQALEGGDEARVGTLPELDALSPNELFRYA